MNSSEDPAFDAGEYVLTIGIVFAVSVCLLICIAVLVVLLICYLRVLRSTTTVVPTSPPSVKTSSPLAAAGSVDPDVHPSLFANRDPKPFHLDVPRRSSRQSSSEAANRIDASRPLLTPPTAPSPPAYAGAPLLSPAHLPPRSPLLPASEPPTGSGALPHLGSGTSLPVRPEALDVVETPSAACSTNVLLFCVVRLDFPPQTGATLPTQPPLPRLTLSIQQSESKSSVRNGIKIPKARWIANGAGEWCSLVGTLTGHPETDGVLIPLPRSVGQPHAADARTADGSLSLTLRVVSVATVDGLEDICISTMLFGPNVFSKLAANPRYVARVQAPLSRCSNAGVWVPVGSASVAFTLATVDTVTGAVSVPNPDYATRGYRNGR